MEAIGSRSGAIGAGREDRGGGDGGRPIRSARILAVGSELTTGDTRDTNASELAADLSTRGVVVTGIVLLPDDRAAIAAALRSALAEVDLVVATGGLGPTPDDLTREGLADAIDETPAVDAALEAWVRELWARRRIPFPESNLKQAWLVPSASPLANGHGTAPGWWVDRPDGRIAVLLPGPPREMRAMWAEAALPRLATRSLGRASVVRLFRLAGIGESHAADRLGRELLEAANPDVATFARSDGVDVRIVALGDSREEAAALADEATHAVRAALGGHVWAEGPATWAQVVDGALRAADRRLVIHERGTNGALVTLLGRCERLVAASVLGAAAAGNEAGAGPTSDEALVRLSLAVELVPGGRDLVAETDVAGGLRPIHERATAFLSDDQGRMRAAVAAAWALLRALRGEVEER
ncbi:MAG TPA: molybdopterin-binding protein [Candidatus Limnocylindrales bacterium]|nr:molybdopterin-binding protein [Candidatus Limnocylindrales bacterium]